MAGMPVATLRIWEQRYQAVRPTTAPSGHRLYSATDVERVTLLRRLTQQGHAIGLLASLDIEQVRALMSAQSAVDTPASAGAPLQRAPLRIVVVGNAMAHRLKHLAARQSNAHSPQYVGFFDALADAVQAAPGWTNARVDLLLWQAGALQTGALSELRAAQDAWGACTVAVAYRYSSAAARAELVSAGVVVAREPADDESLDKWLATLEPAALQASVESNKIADSADLAPWSLGPPGFLKGAVLPPRFAEAALTEFAGLSSGIACECPSHLAELILQISNFETYSGGCASRSAADAQLHAYLQQVAGAARMLFETALERVAVAEGLPLPWSPDGTSSAAHVLSAEM
jgi:DNA-binding transcriptional MerR regulator